MSQHRIDIVEVGPRDGLQNDPADLSVSQKVELIERLIACGVKRMETGSFVSPKAVPKMADSPAVFEGVKALTPARHIALALNEKGVRRAIDAGADEINFVLVASEAFGRANQNMTPQQTADSLAQIVPIAASANIPVSATIAVAFGDPFSGDVAKGQVGGLAAQAQRAGVAEVGIADTIGVATPWQVETVIEEVRMYAPDVYLRAHFHNTRNTGLANVFAAVKSGVDVIDSSCGGIGGCPFAPNATGNIATEDVVYMLERAGFETGIDLSLMIETARWLEGVLGHKVPSGLLAAGAFPPRSAE